jgi:hypothetical protein
MADTLAERSAESELALAPGLLALIVGAALGWYGRYGVIEPERLHTLCNAAVLTGTCAARALLIDITFRGTYGIIAVGASVLVWVTRGRTAAVVAVAGLFAAGSGLQLFDTAWCATGALGILLRLPRIGEECEHRREFSA